MKSVGEYADDVDDWTAAVRQEFLGDRTMKEIKILQRKISALSGFVPSMEGTPNRFQILLWGLPHAMVSKVGLDVDESGKNIVEAFLNAMEIGWNLASISGEKVFEFLPHEYAGAIALEELNEIKLQLKKGSYDPERVAQALRHVVLEIGPIAIILKMISDFGTQGLMAMHFAIDQERRRTAALDSAPSKEKELRSKILSKYFEKSWSSKREAARALSKDIAPPRNSEDAFTYVLNVIQKATSPERSRFQAAIRKAFDAKFETAKPFIGIKKGKTKRRSALNTS